MPRPVQGLSSIQMVPHLLVNTMAGVKSAINRKQEKEKKILKMEILVGIISRHRRQEVKRTEEHRYLREQHRHVFYPLQRHFPHPFELRIRTIVKITKTTWTPRMANVRFFLSVMCSK